ncbi:hypothetical protein Tco_0673541, partial [Tanacetum coccineum]
MSFEDKPVYDSNPNSYNQTPDISNPHSQLLTSSFSQFHCFHCKDPLEDGVRCQRCTCVRCGHYLGDGFCSFCISEAGNSFVNDSNPNSFNDPPNVFTYPPQPQYETYSYELCGNDSHHGYDCPPRVSLEELLNMIRSFCEKFLQQKQAASINQSPLQEMSIQEMEDLKKHYLDEMLSLSNDFQIKDYRNEKIDIRFRRECKDMIDELKSKFNGMSIEINKKKELQHLEQERSIPLRDIISELLPSIAITPVLPTLEPEDSLIMGNKELSTIPKKESDEVIKSSVEDFVPIPSEFEDTSRSDSERILPSCDDFSPINIYEEKSVTFSNPLFDSNDDFTSSNDESLSDEDVSEDNFKIYSNPLFEFDDEYISSDVNALFNEVLEDIECKDSYDSNLDESTLLVTPLFDSNEDEFFIPGDDIELLLHHDLSTPKISVVSILEGFIDEPPLEENDDLFDLKSKTNEWKKILYDAPVYDLMTKDKFFDPGGDIDEIDAFHDVDISTDIKDDYHDSEGDIFYLERLLSNDTILSLPPEVFFDHDQRSLSDNNDLKIMVNVFDPEIHEKIFSPTYVSLTFEDRHYLSFTYVIHIFLSYFTYPVVSPFLLSSGSEDIIFDPGISAFHFSSLKPVAYEFPMEDCPDFEDSRARGFVHCPLNLQSLA